MPSLSTASTATRTGFTASGQSFDALLRATVADLDTFWGKELPRLYGVKYTPLKGGYVSATRSSYPKRCGNENLRYLDIEDNAFYCRTSDYITFDTESLFPELRRLFGDVSLALVLAHESAHAMQARARVALPDVLTELQADCYSGAWLRRIQDAPAAPLAFGVDALNEAIGALIAFRDETGIDASEADAHGNAFDRVTSFQLGYENGAKRCARYRSDPPMVTATRFVSQEDADTGGNLGFSEAVELTAASANEVFAGLAGVETIELQAPSSDAALREALDRCPDGFAVSGSLTVVCPATGTVTVNATRLRKIYDIDGDAGAGYALVLAYAALAQRHTSPSTTASAPFTLGLNCLAGSWIKHVETTYALSPGDLDESIIAATGLPATAPGGKADEVSSFTRVASMRVGYQQGVAACG